MKEKEEVKAEFEKVGFVILATSGFAKLNPELQAKIMKIAISKINKKTNWIVFDPDVKREQLEDEGITLRMPFKGIPENVYAILDDHGSPEMLSMQMGCSVNTQYTLTFLLASEY